MAQIKTAKKKSSQKKLNLITKATEKTKGGKNSMITKLKKAGYGTITKVAKTDPDELSKATGIDNTMAEKLILAAREAYESCQQ